MGKLQKIIGARIKKLRIKRNLTQEDLADKAGLHPSFVAHIEVGKKICSIKTLQKIASALKVPIHSLFASQEKVHKKLYDIPTEKLLSMIEDRSDFDKKLLISIAESIFQRNKKRPHSI